MPSVTSWSWVMAEGADLHGVATANRAWVEGPFQRLYPSMLLSLLFASQAIRPTINSLCLSLNPTFDT